MVAQDKFQQGDDCSQHGAGQEKSRRDRSPTAFPLSKKSARQSTRLPAYRLREKKQCRPGSQKEQCRQSQHTAFSPAGGKSQEQTQYARPPIHRPRTACDAV